jgi:trans-aconitate methyltransferase
MMDKSAAKDQNWDAALYGKSFEFISEFGAGLVALLAPRRGERIVDLGCGVGQLSAQIAAAGCEVIGIDADAEMIALARQNYPDIQFVCAAGADFTVVSPVDAVFSNAALHWMKQPEPVIANVARALRPGGRFVAEMGAHRNVATITEALYQALAEQSVARDKVEFPWYFPRPGQYATLLEAGGFDVTDLHYFVRPTPLDNCPNGLGDWILMFGQNFLAAAPTGGAERLMARAAELCRESLCPDGRWITDYTRLCFRAERFGG